MNEPLDCRAVLDGIADAVIATDAQARIVYLNDAAQRLLGWSGHELLGAPVSALVLPRQRGQARAAFNALLETGPPELAVNLCAMHHDGHDLLLEVRLSRVRAADQVLVVGVLRESGGALTQLSSTRCAMAAHAAVTQALIEARSVESALPDVLQAITTTLGWTAAVFWAARDEDGEPNTLEPLATWSLPGIDLGRWLRETLDARPAPGECLAGIAWQERSLQWTSDVTREPRYRRASAAQANSLRSVLAFPVLGPGQGVVGVLEFLSTRAEQPDLALSQTMAALGFQLAQFVERMRHADQLRDSQEWFVTTLRSIGDAVIATDDQGQVVLVNPVAEALTGWTQDEARGHHLDEVFRIVDETTRLPIESPVARVLREHQVVTLANHTVLLARDGHEHVIEDSAAPILGDDQRFRGVVLCFRDSTDKARIETERRALLEREQAARADAEQQREHFRELLVQAPLAISLHDASDLRYTFVNPRGLQLVEGREVLGLRPEEAFPELPAHISDGLRRAAQGHTTSASEVHMRLRSERDGTATDRYFDIVAQPLRDSRGQVESVMIVALEVTDRALARQRIQKAERQARLLADAVPVIAWTCDADGNTDSFNALWFEYTDSPPGTLEPDACNLHVHPDDLPSYLERWTHALATGQPFRHELRLLRARDRAYRWHLTRVVPLHDEHGHVSRWVGSATDFDDRKRAEEHMRFLAEASAVLGSSLSYQDTLKSVARLAVPRLADWCSIHLVGIDGDNPGTPHQLVVAHRDPEKVRFAELLDEKYPPDPAAQYGVPNVLRTGKPEIMPDIPEGLFEATAVDDEHLRIMRELNIRSGMCLPLVARHRILGAITLVTSESGRRYDEADVAAAQELAERAAHAIDNARLYHEANEAIRIRDDFLSLASHELKTPLTPLHLHIQALQRSARGLGRELSSERMSEKLDTISRQVTRLENLVDSLLDISRITGRQLHVSCDEADLAELARATAERLTHELERSGSTLDLVTPPTLVGCWDVARLDQILSNLLGNAIKFGAGRPIDLSISRHGELARIVVRDRGIGIATEDQARIFDRFERAVSTRHYGGLGLGLWIVRQVVEALDGRIQVESELGQGSTFTVDLPLDARRATGHPAASDTPPEARS